MKKLFLIICLTLISIKCYSQHSDLYTIKLKNGLILKAELVKIVPDSFAIIKQYGLVTKINISEISDISFVETNPTAYTQKNKPAVFKRNIPDSGWSFGYQVGFTMGVNRNVWGWTEPTTSFISRLSVLKKVAEKTQVGALVGFDPYSYYSMVIIPIEAHVRQYFLNKPKSPFVYGNFGYGINISRGNPFSNGGILYGAGIGRSYRTKNQKIVSFMIGFKSQKAKSEISNWNNWGGWNALPVNLNINRFEFRTEVLF